MERSALGFFYQTTKTNFLTDRLGGKEAWRPTYFSLYQTFFCIVQMNFAMTVLNLKEMRKFLWEGREKSLPSWLSLSSFAKLRQPTGQTYFPTFSKKMVAIDEFF